jgi:Na+/H+ antiporter NhaD/arsenite permease-like protein
MYSEDNEPTGVPIEGGLSMEDSQDRKKDRKVKAYEQLCSSYRAIDDFRAKLLALLPLATGGGIFLLVGDKKTAVAIEPYLPAIGLFGFVVTLGLFFFELHGIWKCAHLIRAGTELEENLCIEEKEGQFIGRPLGIFGFINEPFAAGIIYPAVLAAWIFLAMDFELKQKYSVSNLFCDAPWATWIFIVGFTVGVIYDLYLVLTAYFARKKKSTERNRRSMSEQ